LKIARVPRLRASPRHGGAERVDYVFYLFKNDGKIFLTFPFIVQRENSLMTCEKWRGSRGCSPWVASPSGGERGSLSYSLQNIT
jgi:hypothetical protein